MSMNDEYEERTFLQRYGFALGVLGIAAVVALVFGGQFFSKRRLPPRKAPEVTMVRLTPNLPPPPPPPPPPPQTVQEQKMIEQMPVDEQEQKPDEHPAQAAPSLGTNIQGNGAPDGFGLSGPGGANYLRGSGEGRSGGSRWGWYAAEVQKSIGEALRKNRATRNASFRVEVRIWSDPTGRVIRAQTKGTTGDVATDLALQNDVLTGLQLPEPPPAGMPMPVVLRLTARRPN